jgi:hypothetical protein
MSPRRAPRRPVFLAPAGYRRRRLLDAARLLPLFGAVFVLFPVLWGRGADVGRATADDGIYLFLVWLGVILGAVFLSRPLAAETDDPTPDAEEED